MTDSFDIALELRDADPPSPFDPDDYVDVEPLMLGWERFVSQHDGDVNVTVGDHVLPFELRADIGMVFEELPAVLARVAGGDGATELYFAEQGTDVALGIEPAADDVRLTLRRGVTAGAPFQALPTELGTVDRGTFVAQWRRLAELLLDRLEPDLPDDEGLRAYRASLARAETAG